MLFSHVFFSFIIRYSGVLGLEEPHQPIPNLVVKLHCGDDARGRFCGKIAEREDDKMAKGTFYVDICSHLQYDM